MHQIQLKNYFSSVVPGRLMLDRTYKSIKATQHIVRQMIDIDITWTRIQTYREVIINQQNIDKR